ncbi:MAG: PepSY domain-containing protein, partial [Alphaproteobacteria bacterium]|nr:PepSY domain-containing protein [Alphaproteobacteria bacterium]
PLIAFAAVLAGLGAAAIAQDAAPPLAAAQAPVATQAAPQQTTTPVSLADAIASLTARGWIIDEVERKGEGWEIEGRANDGRKVETWLDGRTGEMRDKH